jgi:hypothetical protein
VHRTGQSLVNINFYVSNLFIGISPLVFRKINTQYLLKLIFT